MKPGCFYTIVSFVVIMTAVIFFTGCPRPVGKCMYGEKPAVSGTVKIRLIEKVKMNNKPHYKVSVDGFFKRDFFYEESEYVKCFSSAGYGVGAELGGSILSGGPCPPMYSLDVCRGGK